jgi:predicted permease
VTGAVARDLKHAARSLRANPGLVLLATLSLALGIGANATVFSWARAVLLEPFSAVPGQDRLVKVMQTDRNEEFVSFSYPDYRDLRDRATTLAGLAVVRNAAVTLGTDGRSERVWAQLVSGNFFEVLGVGAQAGRTLTPADDRSPNAHPVAVLSHALWQRRFGGDPGVVGRTVLLNTRAYTVLGVTPPRFRGAGTGVAYDAWVPIMMQEQFEPGGSRLEARGNRWLEAYARLAPGKSREEAEAELTVLSARIAEENERESLGRRVALFPLWRAPRSGAQILGPVILLLAAISAIVRLLACANLASLLLARGVGRRREIAIRLSLGASRGQVVRQLLAESLLLSLVGGVSGVLVASASVDLLEAWVPATGFPVALGARLDGSVVAFAAGVALLTTLAFGLAPALHSVRAETGGALRDESAGVVGGRGRNRLRSGLVVAQVALSVLLLVAAGLFLRTLQRLQSADLGFEPRGVLVASMELFTSGYDRERGLAFYRNLLEEARALPGVEAASLVRRAPLGFGGTSSTSFVVEGYEVPKDQDAWAYFNNVGPGYFGLMKTALLKGRDLTEEDREDAPAVAVVNETMAARYWPGKDAVGGRFRLGERWISVVGVARSTSYRELGEKPAPWFFLPLHQGYRPDMTLLVRTGGDAAALARPVGELVRRLDPAIAPYGVTTLSEFIGAADFRQRVGSQLLGLFGSLGLVLACVGLYGVLSFSVARRTREIGIRMALGGARRDIFRLVLRQGASLVVVGLAVGLAAAGAVSRLLRSLLLDLSPWDPLAFAGVVVVLLGSAFVACAVPARRATRVDPVTALRQE